MVKILHSADFHLDSAFTALSESRARQRRQECRQLVDRLVDYCMNTEPDAFTTGETVKRLNRLIDRNM